MNNAMFNRYYEKYFVVDKSIQRLARKLAKNDRALYEDLVQVGLIALWKLNPKNAVRNEDAWIRQALKRRMIDFLRKDRPKDIRLDSLDARLAAGDQLEKDPETGQFHLVEYPGKSNMFPRDLVRPVTPPAPDDDDAVIEKLLQYMEQDEHST